ncbi:Asp-tRNA(Asn)/Glu-tRNA(Gln) amidotransferase subunit GatC [Megalodesulfovibrio gigas]|uniref:Aspartyl/glutamyl-tRNA(Asn/Gln) amidotransferase subunit C n=1 Tax=Megalodesulfovibrio gigas (strain ATCC 19364 / DSM 1382 / NCIMB 9332 / VKM B-1759) TaxID=1121448 RepID=T2GFF5_MEGG1|nr:Asp-tRNA(Asn)/Glu-tRNA(Gln) amidotransferase subunit GatC [Megalodesulfovibrio gigas]AGW14914.1 putative aspartyl/glutamyl-tRNA(Asn/Gln) amidotransferase subunit C [Megalodesulfovibrio gigas DSM 1382 = ATCC 19364]
MSAPSHEPKGLSSKDAAAIARLARLSPDDALLERFARQANDILAAMETLAEVDTAGVAPLYSPMEHAPVLREDVALQVHSREDLLANAPETDGQFFMVPRIV